MPQKFDFFPNVTVEEALDYVCQLKGVRQHSQRKREIEQKLEQVGLIEQRKKRFRALSGGMKQRLGIAQVMISDPKLLLVDEPTVGLDPQERVSFRQLLTTLASDRIIILSTHIVEDIALTAQHVLVLHAGKVQYMGDIPAFIATVEGKVWLYRGAIVPDEIQRSTMIISSQATADGVEIRYLADIPVPNSFPLEATLEHAYIYANRKKGHYE
ncbi:ATP-binding cassette domain-containing protein [Paenibacillus sp. UY79]|nr:ATP-binding cassette domain-containing protein [Paenibacillus farraposensis]